MKKTVFLFIAVILLLYCCTRGKYSLSGLGVIALYS
jgi:hypothetical protein